MQSDSPPDTGTTPDSRSLTDLWRDMSTGYATWTRSDCVTSLAALEDTRDQFRQRIATVGELYRTSQELAEGRAR